MTENEIKRLLTTLGLCAKARKLIYGTEQICDALKTGKNVFMVVEASDTSDNTHKRLTDRAAFYGVRHVRIEADTVMLGESVGKRTAVAAVGITDEGLCRAVELKLGS